MACLSHTLPWISALRLGQSQIQRSRSCAGLRGLRAATQIKEGDLIALIPRRLSIWTSTASPCPFPDWIDKETFRNAPLQLRLALCLLHERALGPASKVRLSACVLDAHVLCAFMCVRLHS